MTKALADVLIREILLRYDLGASMDEVTAVLFFSTQSSRRLIHLLYRMYVFINSLLYDQLNLTGIISVAETEILPLVSSVKYAAPICFF